MQISVQQRERTFASFYPNAQMHESPLKSDTFVSASARQPLMVMSTQEQLQARLRRGVQHLAHFYPNSTESELHDVLQKCNLNEELAFKMLINDKYDGHMQQAKQRF
jgi:hypothetical protein